jgi:hypothetical protein
MGGCRPDGDPVLVDSPGPRRYAGSMADHGNLADPAYEPTDEELAGLMREAFRHLGEERAESLRLMRDRISRLGEEARLRLLAARQVDEGS